MKIDKYVIWLSEEEYKESKRKYQIQKLSDYELKESITPDW